VVGATRVAMKPAPTSFVFIVIATSSPPLPALAQRRMLRNDSDSFPEGIAPVSDRGPSSICWTRPSF
jgi:hypothetical protein